LIGNDSLHAGDNFGPDSLEKFTEIALSLRERVELSLGQLFRLVGVGLSNFQVDAEIASPLFQTSAIEEIAAISAPND
jgi:DNA polymerase IV